MIMHMPRKYGLTRSDQYFGATHYTNTQKKSCINTKNEICAKVIFKKKVQLVQNKKKLRPEELPIARTGNLLGVWEIALQEKKSESVGQTDKGRTDIIQM